MVSEGHVMSQGGAFMLFYEAVDDSDMLPPQSATTEYAYESTYEDVHLGTESTAESSVPDDISAPSTVTDYGSSTSRATSVSLPVEETQSGFLSTKSLRDADVVLNDELESPAVIIA
jgi:ubiquitin carboxyl-terminal hydrolase 1